MGVTGFYPSAGRQSKAVVKQARICCIQQGKSEFGKTYCQFDYTSPNLSSSYVYIHHRYKLQAFAEKGIVNIFWRYECYDTWGEPMVDG